MPGLCETCGSLRKIHTKGDERVPLEGERTRKGRISAALPGLPRVRQPGPVRWQFGRRRPGLEGLLDLDRAASFLELSLDRVGLLAGDALLDRARCPVDEILRLLEAEIRDRADDLDHLDLLVAGGREDDIELGLLLARGSVAARGRSCAGGGHRDRSGGGYAPL